MACTYAEHMLNIGHIKTFAALSKLCTHSSILSMCGAIVCCFVFLFVYVKGLCCPVYIQMFLPMIRDADCNDLTILNSNYQSTCLPLCRTSPAGEYACYMRALLTDVGACAGLDGMA